MQALQKKQKTWALLLLGALLGLAAFLCLYGTAPLDPVNDAWIWYGYDETDIHQHYAGWLGFRNSSWQFPLAQADALAYPAGTGVNISFTDSLPWVSVLFKLLAPVLPAQFQWFGLYELAAFILQGMAAALVLGLYPLMRRAQEKPRYMGYVLAAMLVVSGAFVVFVETCGFPADMDAENLASGIGNAWKMLGAVAGMTLAWLLDRRYIHFETQAVWWVQVIKVAVGMALLLAIKSGLKAPLLALLGHEGLAGGVRYFLLVLVAGAIWPLVFRPMSKWGKGKK